MQPRVSNSRLIAVAGFDYPFRRYWRLRVVDADHNSVHGDYPLLENAYTGYWLELPDGEVTLISGHSVRRIEVLKNFVTIPPIGSIVHIVKPHPVNFESGPIL